MTLSNETLKLVTVRPNRAFRIGNGTFTSVVNKIPLSIASINHCLEEKAFVTEHLAGGREVPLDFANYNQDNGPSAVPEGAIEFVQDTRMMHPEVEVFDQNGNKKHILNQRTVIANKPVEHIDLEASKAKAAQEAAEAKAKEEETKALEEAKKEQERIEALKKKDEEDRKKAVEKIMEREKAKAAKGGASVTLKTSSNSSPSLIQEGFAATTAHVSMNSAPANEDVVAVDKIELPKTEEPKSDLTKSNNQDTTKTKFDNHNNNGKKK